MKTLNKKACTFPALYAFELDMINDLRSQQKKRRKRKENKNAKFIKRIKIKKTKTSYNF